jgi:hypothetical protein
LTTDLVLQIPPAAVIIAGIAYYFRTAAFAQEYGDKIEKLRTHVLARMLTEASKDAQARAPLTGSIANPYFPEAGLDRLVLERILSSQETADYQSISNMPETGNAYLRWTGLSLVGLGLSYYAILLFLPLGYVVFSLAFLAPSFTFGFKYHRLVGEIDRRTTDLKMGIVAPPWEK